MSTDLAALSDAWVKFLPRDAKSSSFTFVVANNGAPLPCKLKIAFHYYIEAGRSTYAGDSLHEVLRSFIDGSDPFPPHPGAVFDSQSLKVKTIAPGYSRTDALAKLAPVLRAAFPATSAPPAKSASARMPRVTAKRGKPTTSSAGRRAR